MFSIIDVLVLCGFISILGCLGILAVRFAHMEEIRLLSDSVEHWKHMTKNALDAAEGSRHCAENSQKIARESQDLVNGYKQENERLRKELLIRRS